MDWLNNFITNVEMNKDNHKFDVNEIEMIKKAAIFANEHHKGQKRKSGEDYIMHPITVANILLSWSLDSQTIIAALLHDLIEDTSVTYELIRDEFNEEIAYLVKSISKVSHFSSENRSKNIYDNANNNYIIQVFMNMCKDIRILFIKIADRYHNMLTISSLDIEKQKRIAFETQEIYASIAGRIGMFSIKTELLDMCFKILKPEKFLLVSNFVEQKTKESKPILEKFIEKINFLLTDNNIKFRTYYRVKGIWSTNEKMKITDDIYDLFAARILVENILDCYLILGILHLNFHYNNDTFKDFISTPKINLYQSIHTSLYFEDINIEIQIRTEDMEQIANFGLAAHWQYKEKINNEDKINEFKTDFYTELSTSSSIEQKLTQIKELSKKKLINIYNQNDNKWKSINQKNSAIDYCFLINKELFPYIKNIFVNGRDFSLYGNFEPGDMVRVFYNEKITINKSWIGQTRDNYIKKYISNYLAEINQNIAFDEVDLLKLLSKSSHEKIQKKYIRDFVYDNFKCKNIREFLALAKTISLSNNQLITLFCDSGSGKLEVIDFINKHLYKWLVSNSLFLPVENVSFKNIIIGSCCSKVPQMQVVGVLQNDVMIVHKHDCPSLEKKKVNKTIVLYWDKEKTKESNRMFIANFKIVGVFGENISTLIINTIIKFKSNIKIFDLKKNKELNKTFRLNLVIYVKNYNHIEKIMNELTTKGLINSWKLI